MAVEKNQEEKEINLLPLILDADNDYVDLLDTLEDTSGTGRERPWQAKKVLNGYLAIAYAHFNRRKAVRLLQCATTLIFNVLPSGQKKLSAMNSCRIPLCPICAWRRSLKIFYHVDKIMKAMGDDYAYILLTLTVKNCEGKALSGLLDRMMAAWHNMNRCKFFKGAVQGWYRGLEITHDTDECITKERYIKAKQYYCNRGLKVGDLNPGYNSYHPHFHCILAVPKTYFRDRTYIKQEQWTEQWQQAMRLDYKPDVDVRKLRGTEARDVSKAVAEAAKYAVKETDYIIATDWDLSVETTQLLDKAIAGRRLVAYGGVMKKWHKELNLDDEVDGDLIHIGDTSEEQGNKGEIEAYVWRTGYNNYFRYYGPVETIKRAIQTASAVV